jgi:hypothetical protein
MVPQPYVASGPWVGSEGRSCGATEENRMGVGGQKSVTCSNYWSHVRETFFKIETLCELMIPHTGLVK